MLSKQNRLQRDDFNHYFKVGTRFHSPIATMIVAPAETFKGSVVVSKKVSKSAVKRNLLRRQVYALLQAAQQQLGNMVCIIILKPAVTSLSRKDRAKQLTALIEQARNNPYNSEHV